MMEKGYPQSLSLLVMRKPFPEVPVDTFTSYQMKFAEVALAGKRTSSKGSWKGEHFQLSAEESKQRIKGLEKQPIKWL